MTGKTKRVLKRADCSRIISRWGVNMFHNSERFAEEEVIKELLNEIRDYVVVYERIDDDGNKVVGASLEFVALEPEKT